MIFYKRKSKWRAYIKQDQKHIHIGIFDTAEEAAIARDKTAIELRGEFATLNFPHLHELIGDER